MNNVVAARHIRSLRVGVFAAVAMLLVALVGVDTSDATGTTYPKPTAIVAVASTDNSALGGAVPDVLVAKGQPFQLTITLEPYNSRFPNDTRLTLTPSLATGGTPAGAFSPLTVLMPGGANSATFSVKYSAVDNGVILTAAVKNPVPSRPVTPGSTAPFDVLKALTTFPADDPRLTQGLSVGNSNCNRNTTEPECGTIVLANGIASAAGALSLGACTSDLGCAEGSQVVQFIADLGDKYSPEHPALLIIRCAKELCVGKGVNSYEVALSFAATGPLDLTAAPCVTKGVALDSNGNDYCTDYRQSHRDNAGDLLLYLLFTHDMRGSTR